MSDLISRQEAIAHIKNRLYEMSFNIDAEHPYYEEIADNRIETWINELPSVHSEIIRCKDCVHLEILNGSTYYARCRWHGRLFESFGRRADTRTWFCADGKRLKTPNIPIEIINSVLGEDK